MSWWNKLREKLRGTPTHSSAGEASKDPAPPEEPRAVWLSATDKGNPFGIPILNLMSNLGITSTSRDRDVAERSMSWRANHQDRLAWDIEGGEVIPCDLAYRAETSLPNGMLFVPTAMEDKWVIAWKDGRIAAGRSWTGETEAIADAVLEGDVLRVTSLTIAPESMLAAFGDPVITFDWLMKSHALGERIPLPVSDEGAQVLEKTPLASFGPYGHRVFCAAKAYTPPAGKRPLRSDGALIAAVEAADLERVRALVAEGADVRARSTVGGYAPLHIAIVKRDPALIELLLQLGADANQPADQHRQPLVLALVHKLAPELLDALLAAGADLDGADHRKFGVLHAASEVGNVIGIEHMLAKGADIHARTDIGLTPLHIACALGHLAAAQALHAHGADIHAQSDIGSPLDGARSEGKAEVVAWLESLPIAV